MATIIVALKIIGGFYHGNYTTFNLVDKTGIAQVFVFPETLEQNKEKINEDQALEGGGGIEEFPQLRLLNI